MKAVINNNELSKELKKMSLAIKKNPVIPILDCVKLSFSKNSLEIMATDLETTYISTIDCECKVPFILPMVYSDIMDVCSKASAPLEVELKDTSIKIKTGKSVFNFSLRGKPEDFPKIPEEEYKVELDVDGDFFYHLNNANICRNKEFMMVNTNMPCIDVKKDKIVLAGTDNHGIYKKTILCKNKKEIKVMVCDNFVQSCKNFQETKLSIGETHIRAEYGNEIVISRLSENKFPDYDVVIPSEPKYNLSVSNQELRHALSSINVAANKTAPSSLYVFNPEGINLFSQDVDFGKDAEISVSAINTVGFEKINLNIPYMERFLSLISEDEIEMSFTAPNRGVLIKPKGDDSVLCLQMPLMLEN